MLLLPNFRHTGISVFKSILVSFSLLFSQLAFTQNVGIGTLTPEDKLHILGNLRIAGGKIYFVNTGGSVFVGEEAGLNDDLADNFNVFIGHHAGRNNVDGNLNVGIGAFTLQAGTSTFGNVGVGNEVLASTSLTGSSNTAMGIYALHGNTSGTVNTAFGREALKLNTTGNYNVAMGFSALFYSGTGDYNTAIGSLAGISNLGSNNTFLGFGTGEYNISGSNNVFIGRQAGANETGSDKLYISNSDTSTPLLFGEFDLNRLTINDTLITKFMRVNGSRIDVINAGNSVFIGDKAGKNDDLTDNKNTFVGYRTGESAVSGNNNVAIGGGALFYGTTASNNVAIGNESLKNNNGTNNTALGRNAGYSSIGGSQNVYLGTDAGFLNNGTGNIFLGYSAGGLYLGSNKLYIDNSSTDFPLLFGDFDQNKLTINDTLITERLYISEGANDGYILRSNASGKGSWVSPSSVFTNHWSASGNDIYKNNSGNVGIGITSPMEKMHVKGNMAIDSGRISVLNNGESILIGKDAGMNDNLSGLRNTYIGDEAGKTNTGSNNIAIGANALDGSSMTTWNVAIGNDALGHANLTGFENVAIGHNSLINNTTGIKNVVIGYNAFDANNTGYENVVIGTDALGNGTTNARNVAVGIFAGNANSGDHNTFLGSYAGFSSEGSNNVIIGRNAGYYNTGSGNIFIGHEAGTYITGSNKLCIENSYNDVNPLIYGDFSANEVGINTSSPNSTFEIGGTMAAKFNNNKTAGTDHPDGTGMFWRYTTGTGTITLPAAGSCANRIYTIVNHTGAARTITSYTNLNNTASTSIADLTSITLVSDGGGWFQVK